MRGNIARVLRFFENAIGLRDGVGWKFAHHADLPVCNESRRGWEYRVQGGAGVADRKVRCEKNAAGAYAWTEGGLAAQDARYVNVPGDTMSGALLIDGSADTTQLQVDAHSTQTAVLAAFRDSAGNIQVTISGDGAVVINEEGNNADFRIEGENDTSLIFADASADRVGIGTNAPSARFAIDGSADTTQLQVDAHGTQTTLLVRLRNEAGSNQITFSGNGAAVFNEDGNDADFRIETDADANAFFLDASANTVSIPNLVPQTQSTTIASDSIAVSSTFPIKLVTLDTEAAAATDNLSSITGGATGQVLILCTTNDARDVVVVHGTGANNIQLAGNADFTLATNEATLTVAFNAGTWIEVARSAG